MAISEQDDRLGDETDDGFNPLPDIDPLAVACEYCGQVCQTSAGLAQHLRFRGDAPHEYIPRINVKHNYLCDIPKCTYRAATDLALIKHKVRTHNIGKVPAVRRATIKQSANDPERLARVKKWHLDHPGESAARSREKTRAVRRDWKPIFLEAYAKTGYLSEAYKIAQIDQATVHQVRVDNPEFERVVSIITADIHQQRLDKVIGSLEEDAIGRYEDVFYDGEVVGQRLVRNTQAAMFLAKALDPEVYDPGVRSSRITATTMILTTEERRAQLKAVEGILDDMVPSRRALKNGVGVIDVEVGEIELDGAEMSINIVDLDWHVADPDDDADDF